MKLQTKLSLLLVGGVLFIYVLSCFSQRYVNLNAIGRFSQKCRGEETARQWAWVECLQNATEVSLLNAMAAGEMDKFEKILADERQVPGLLELTLFDARGHVAYSSDPAQAKKQWPVELGAQLQDASQPVKRLTADAFEIYEPVRADKSCIECHKERSPGQFCGILSLRFSTATVKAADQSWASFDTGFRQTNLITSAVTVVLFTLGMGLLVILLVRYQVARPLQGVARSLTEQAADVDIAAGQMSAASQTLAEGASEQAASLEETSSSLEELSSATRGNHESASHAATLAAQAREAADKGVAGMQAMNTAMSAIKDSSHDIAKIIKTIDEIAFQTNILALNAAVEAARAGESGMGFAVVAEEVRNLAGRSAQAARETAAKIEEAIHRSAQGAEINQKVTSVLGDIVDKARRVDELVSDVATASREQTQGITQINLAVNQMDKVTQNNAASAEETAAAAGELNQRSQGMKSAVQDLLQLIHGDRHLDYSVTRPPEFASAQASSSSPRPSAPRPILTAHRPNDQLHHN